MVQSCASGQFYGWDDNANWPISQEMHSMAHATFMMAPMRSITTAFLCLAAWGSALAEMRTWTFTADGIIDRMSFKRGGRIQAEFIRLANLNGTNAVYLQAETGAKGWV